MKLARILPVVTALGLLATLTVFSADADAQSAGERAIVVALKGTAQGEPRTLQLPDGPVDAVCFTVDLIDVASGQVIGSGQDCLANITPNDHGVTLTDYTYFHFPYGTLIAKSEVTVQESGLAFPAVTHLTGAHPPFGANSIVQGTGRFQGVTGRVRLSGGTDMSRMDTGVMGFDCIFVVELD